ncbi:RICIN domain-containing protein [Kitasatospora sp. NPDC054939]
MCRPYAARSRARQPPHGDSPRIGRALVRVPRHGSRPGCATLPPWISHANGARAQQWLCDGGAETMRWRIERQGGNTYRIVNVNSGKCLEIADGSYEDGARAQQWACENLPVMRWYVEPQDGAWMIYNEETLRCLEIADSSLADGARAQQWACAYIATQLWDILE